MKVRAKRDKLRKESRGSPWTVSEHIGQRRAIYDKARELKRKLEGKKKKLQLEPHEYYQTYRPSEVLDALYQNRKKDWKPVYLRKRNPEPFALEVSNFSFLDDPIGTLNSIREMARIETEEWPCQLHFRDQYCLDIGPYLFLAQMSEEMLQVFNGGAMSSSVSKVLHRLGMGPALKMRLPTDPGGDDVWAFPIRRRHRAGSSESVRRHYDTQRRETVADELCEQISDWLAEAAQCEFSKEGKGHISTMFGEILDNAERHSASPGDDGGWSTAGFMAKRARDDGEDRFLCHLGFLSTGVSFSKGLETAAPKVQHYLDDYCRRGRQDGWPQSEETLRTLVALQDGVTRTSDRRGTGLMEVLDMAAFLGMSLHESVSARVTIVSGRACIQLREPYIHGRRAKSAKDPRHLWCNPANGRHERPDGSFVYDLPHQFPGTLISVGFTLDQHFLGKLANERN